MRYNWVFILWLLWFSLSFTFYCLHKHEKQCRQNVAVVIFTFVSSMTANAECRRKFRGLRTPWLDPGDKNAEWTKYSRIDQVKFVEDSLFSIANKEKMMTNITYAIIIESSLLNRVPYVPSCLACPCAHVPYVFLAKMICIYWKKYNSTW